MKEESIIITPRTTYYIVQIGTSVYYRFGRGDWMKMSPQGRQLTVVDKPNKLERIFQDETTRDDE